MRLGMNVSPPYCASTALPFGDLMTGSGGWFNLPKGVTTWPFAGVLPPTGQNMLSTGYLPAGTYTITCGGIGKLAIGWPGSAAGTFSFTGANEVYSVVLPAPTPKASVGITIQANSLTTPLHDLHVAVPGAVAGQMWHPEYLASLAPFATLRSMDWLGTNASKIACWADRPTRPGFELEGFLDLCARTDCDPWINLPHLCSTATGVTDYPGKLGALIAASVDPARTVYLEYSNECWNWGNPFSVQTQYCLAQGKLILDPATGQPFAWGMPTKAYGWLANQAYEATVAAVPAGGPKLVPVFAGQASYYPNSGGAWLPMAAQYGWKVGAIACAPYTGWVDASPYTIAALSQLGAVPATMADAVGLFLSGLTSMLWGPVASAMAQLNQWQAAAQSIKVPLLYYECGLGCPAAWNNPGSLPVVHAADADPRMAAFMQVYLAAISAGADLGNYYEDCRPDVWGLRQNADDVANQRYQGVLSFAREFNA
jgi:hypothetical protein